MCQKYGGWLYTVFTALALVSVATILGECADLQILNFLHMTLQNLERLTVQFFHGYCMELALVVVGKHKHMISS